MSAVSSSKGNLITIDEDNGIPIWLQLHNRLVYLISAGTYQPGEKLTSIRELAVIIGVNYNTVGKAYKALEQDGYIVSVRGRGMFVADTIPVQDDSGMSSGADYLADDFIRQCEEQGLRADDIIELVQRKLKKK